MPTGQGYGGTGGPGRVLKEIAGVNGGNLDIPDGGKWELKWHSGSALLTLFHKEAQPRGHMKDLVSLYGLTDDDGRLSFRHTIRGQSSKRSGKEFRIVKDGERIIVRHPHESDFSTPYWTYDTLMSAFAAKFRRLIVVDGSTSTRKGEKWIIFNSAKAFEEPKISKLIDAIVEGVVAIDFDARTTDGKGLRNHGTKFRIRYDDLPKLYGKIREVAP